jgi:cellulose synthase (UDP-forming)
LDAELDGLARTIADVLGATEAVASRHAGAGPAADADARRTAALDLADLHRRGAGWIEQQAARWEGGDHTDGFFADRVLSALAADLRRRAVLLDLDDPAPAWPELIRAHRNLLAVFDADISCFERKRYENLSHEPNKAMNLNSYLSLLGSRWREVHRPDGLHLERVDDGAADLDAVEPAFVLTLDADSLLLPDYAARLVQVMQAPGNERLAVVQTPYRAIPGSTSELERVAGATTDVQHVIHQGFARHGATYWVGANALLRKQALDDIAEVGTERGHQVVRYIQDRTVIEDTESSIDLVERGWSLANYPATLAYSATPPDFGALVIQRRRWANGGLIILPKLLRLLRRRRPGRLREGALRVHYLTSIAGTNVGLVLLLCYGFPGVPVSPWLPLSAVGYFALYARDLAQLGYRASDVVRVYALNVLLVPVNLAGVLTSVRQGVSGSKIPFGRTPKVDGRTGVPRPYLLVPLALVVLWSAASAFSLATGRAAYAAFTAVNVALLAYALARFVGWQALQEDLRRR